MQPKRLLIIPLILGMMPFLAACSQAGPDRSIAVVTPPAQAKPGSANVLAVGTPDQMGSPQNGGTTPEGFLLTPTPQQTPRKEYPSPNATPLSTEVLPPFPQVRLPDGVQVLALLGTDSDAPYLGRTDTILLVFYNVHNGNASLLSIPRDLYVYIPGYTMDRINTAYVSGGIDLLFETLEYNLGIHPNHWALAHLNDFSRFVDDLGGVTVQVGTPVEDPWCSVPAGTVHLSGYSALCYVRSRMGSSDFDRSRRQQDVLLALFWRFIRLDSLSRLPEWYGKYAGTVHSDLGLADLLSFIPLAVQAQNGNVHHYQISWKEVTAWQVPSSGASVLLPDRDKILPILQQAAGVLDDQATASPTQSPAETTLPPAGGASTASP